MVAEPCQFFVEALNRSFLLLQQIGNEGLLALFKYLPLRQKLLDIIDLVVRIPHRIPFYPQTVLARLAGESAQMRGPGSTRPPSPGSSPGVRRGSPSLRFLIAAKR